MNDLFYNFLAFIKGLVGNWGVAMIIFTILIRAALTPLDMKSRVGMRKTQKLQPQLQALQKKYANDKDKLNAKTAELYKKEHVNPMSSCLPLLLTWPILIIVFNAMRMAANQEMLKQMAQVLNGAETIQMEPFLWIKNLWMPDNLFKTAFPDEATLKAIPLDQWQKWFNGLADGEIPIMLREMGITSIDSDAVTQIIEKIASLDIYKAQTALNPEMVVPLFNWTVPETGNINGWLLLPVLSALSQIVMTKITTGNQPQQPAANGQPNTGKFLQYFFPVFSLWICLNATASFALYWVAGNLVIMVQTIVINKVLDKREAEAATVAGEGSVK